MARQPERGTQMATKEPNEKKIKQKILKALRQKIDGKMARLKQSELNVVVGKTNIRAAYLESLLREMKEELRLLGIVQTS
jgi:cob(I)alamin adenosyltransferase